MTTTKLSNMTSSVRMLTRVMNAADVNKDGALGTDEIKRIGIRDNFLTRNTVNKAIRTAAFGNDDVTIDQTVGALEQSVRSATRADKNGDKALSPAEAKKASILARQLQKFTDLNGDKTLADFKVTPREEPGTAAYAKLTQKEYQETLDLFGRPQFGTAMMLELSEVPSKARAKIAAMAAANPGTLQISSWKINDSLVYFSHVINDTRAQVLAVNAKGSTIASGLASEVTHNKKWSVRWN